MVAWHNVFLLHANKIRIACEGNDGEGDDFSPPGKYKLSIVTTDVWQQKDIKKMADKLYA